MPEFPRSRPLQQPASPASPPSKPSSISIAKWAAIGVLALLIIVLAAWAIVSTRSAKPKAPDHVVAPATVPSSTPAPSQTASAGSSPASNPKPSPSAPRGSLLNLNTATAAQLQALPGIGPSMAQRLIDKRTTLGSFRSWDDVDAVEGIGPTTLEKLKAAATID